MDAAQINQQLKMEVALEPFHLMRQTPNPSQQWKRSRGRVVRWRSRVNVKGVKPPQQSSTNHKFMF